MVVGTATWNKSLTPEWKRKRWKVILNLHHRRFVIYHSYQLFGVHHLDYRESRNRTVVYRHLDRSISCSCRKFEFQGVLCAHALRVFRKLECQSLPAKYYLERWSKAISNKVFETPSMGVIFDVDDQSIASEYSELTHMSQRILAQSIGSKDKVSVVRNSFSDLSDNLASMALNDGESDGNNEDTEEQINMLDPVGRRSTPKDKRRRKCPLERASRNTGETSRASENIRRPNASRNAPPQPRNAPPQPKNAPQQPIFVSPQPVFHNPSSFGVAPPQPVFHNP